jgi:hypothetical protein
MYSFALHDLVKRCLAINPNDMMGWRELVRLTADGVEKARGAWGDLELECEADEEFGVGRVVKVRK